MTTKDAPQGTTPPATDGVPTGGNRADASEEHPAPTAGGSEGHPAPTAGGPEEHRTITVGGPEAHLALALDVTPRGVAVARVADLGTGREWFGDPGGAPLATCRVVTGQGAVSGDSRRCTARPTASAGPDGSAAIGFGILDLPVHLDLTIRPAPDGSLRFGGRVTSSAGEPISVEVAYPWFVGAPADRRTEAMVPIEIGAVRPCADGQVHNGGFFAHRTFACAGSVFPLAHVGEPGAGSGIVVSAVELGDATLVFEAGPTGCGCRWTAYLTPGASADLPECMVDTTDGRWPQALDRYRALVARPSFADTPDWLRRAGAIYNPLAEGGGGIYQTEPTVGLAERIGSFAELPTFLDEAKSLGTQVVQLFDYWEKSVVDGRPDYWHKGDYVPRADLGGLPALTAGVEAVHAAGGRVLFYLEPFILYARTPLGRSVGARWAARDPWTGDLVDTYPDNYSMPPWHTAWSRHLVETATWLAREVGADGIFLDSFGWQWNWVCTTRSEPGVRDAAAWNRGVLDLAAEVRAAVRAVRADAVVLTEALTVPLATQVDGGLDASFAWNHELNEPGPLRSPARHAYPELNFFGNGRTLAQLREVFTTGVNLALSRRWSADRAQIARLVGLRRTHADALVDGRVTELTAGEVYANLFTGARSRVVVGLNRSTQVRELALPGSGPWREIHPVESRDTPSGVRLLEPGELVVLLEHI